MYTYIYIYIHTHVYTYVYIYIYIHIIYTYRERERESYTHNYAHIGPLQLRRGGPRQSVSAGVACRFVPVRVNWRSVLIRVNPCQAASHADS